VAGGCEEAGQFAADAAASADDQDLLHGAR
jgi:hypothetical protein